ncbi:hypothetical protein [Pontixanthobacter sp.]|uniref:hypothetical protein n=1 Tax=Pontixanthobacter sp. TaxID=2792078 RepID=UPI003C7DA597
MFEGSIPIADSSEPLEAGGLRLISWPELVAHFDAARELRSGKSPAALANAGSFSVLSKALAEADSAHINKTDVRVNPTILGHSKVDASRVMASADDAPMPIREQP